MNKKLWEGGRRHEIEFWSNWLETGGSHWKQDYINRLDPALPFQDYLIKYLPKGPDVSVLDVGSGPLTPLGKVLAGYKLGITAVDPLADEYNDILKKYGIIPIVQTQYGEVERLTEIFPRDYFDFIHVSNALDHSYDPLEGIRQMMAILRRGCYIFMAHNTNEAEKENYVGFHQWNFCQADNQFVIWNEKTRISINDILTEHAEVNIFDHLNWNVVEIRKK